MFCTKCGTEIKAGSNFCTGCGTRTDAGQPQAPRPVREPAQSANSGVVWVFGAQRKYSMFKMTPCNIVFMPDKLLIAYLTPALQKAENARLSAELKAQGKGFFSGSAAMVGFWADYYKKYYRMTEAAILAEDPLNVQIPYGSITGVLFRGFSETVDYDDSASNVTQGKLHFTLAGGETLKFAHSQSADRSIKDLLTRFFGTKLKYKR